MWQILPLCLPPVLLFLPLVHPLHRPASHSCLNLPNPARKQMSMTSEVTLFSPRMTHSPGIRMGTL